MIYLDNAATTYPKPQSVGNALSESLLLYGANPGRSGHNDSLRTAARIFDTREKLNSFLGGYGPENVAFTYNCTYALNLAIKGVVYNGCHIVISSMEHNSVFRPVSKLAQEGICTYSVAQVSDDDAVTIESFRRAVNANTGLIICTHASNVTGKILPVREISRIAREAGAVLIVDAAQSAGHININIKDLGADCLCVPGHKGMYGIMGTGALLFNGRIKNTLIEGGTGSKSFDSHQPDEFPDRLESGTLNVPGIVCLSVGCDFVSERGIDAIRRHEAELLEEAYYELKRIDGVSVIGSGDYVNKYIPLLSFNCGDYHSEQTASRLNSDGIAVRAGLHCAPLAHETMGTASRGLVRVSPSVFSDKKDIKSLIKSVRKIAN